MSLTGRVAGADLRGCAARVAGWLAEEGASRLVLVCADGERRELHVRRTDLPGELAAAGNGARLECGEAGIAFEIEPGGIVWRAEGEEEAARLRGLSGAG